MKLQVSFDISDLEQALSIAEKIEEHVDIFEIGALLLYKYGESAIKAFNERFPHRTLLADAKIIDRSKDAVLIFIEAGADWITVMAGAGRTVIHTACTVAHAAGKKIMLDLADASSPGQAALEAKSLGVDALMFHKPTQDDEHLLFIERWEMVKGNTTLPIFISAHISRENISEILPLDAAGIVIGTSIVQSAEPEKEIAFYAELLGKK